MLFRSNVHWVENIILGDAETSILYANNGVDYGQTISIDASALTGTHTLDWDGSSADMYMNVIGGDGDDEITTGINADTINGGAGADSILAGEGSDRIVGGAGADSIYGGSGNDTLVFNTGDVASGEEFYGGNDSLDGGMDQVYVETSTDFSGAVVSDEIEELKIAAGQTSTFDLDMGGFLTGLTTIYGSGTSAGEKIEFQGDGTANTMNLSGITAGVFSSMGAEDFIHMQGFAGDDVLTAAVGFTHLDGGAGADELHGSAADDTFIFNTGDVESGELIEGAGQGSQEDRKSVV